MIAGYFLILAPGHLYNAIVSEDWALFRKHIIRYFFIATGVLVLRLIRGVLRTSSANLLRHRLTSRLHTSYLTNTDRTKYDAPYYRFINSPFAPDNPDQRIATDTRLFSMSLLDIIAGPAPDMGGVIESVASLSFYSYTTFLRAGWYGLLVAYLWSGLVSFATIHAVNYTTPTVFLQERFEADLRFKHASLRRLAEPIALLRGSAHEHYTLTGLLRAAVQNTWSVIFRTTVLNFVQYGFGYYMSVIMYVSLAIAIGTTGGSGIGYDSSWTPGKKAMWISQTGGVLMQLMYSFTMLVQLGSAMTELASHTHRVWELVDASDDDVIADVDSDSTPLMMEEDINASGAIRNGETNNGIIVEKVTVWAGGQRQSVEDLEAVEGDNKRLLGPVSLKVGVGEWTLLQGPSGCGKTSIVRVLRGLWEPASGYVAVPRGCYFSPQDAYIQGGVCSLRDVVCYPKLCDGTDMETKTVIAALQKVGWPGDVTAHGVDQEADWASRASPGEKQLLGIARVLVHKPAFVVLDEPTSSMDPRAEVRVMNELKTAGISGLTVAHSTSLQRFHDYVVDMSR